MARFNPNEVVFTFLAHHRAHCTSKRREVVDRLASFAATPPARLFVHSPLRDRSEKA
jgi:hypothetical protein